MNECKLEQRKWCFFINLTLWDLIVESSKKYGRLEIQKFNTIVKAHYILV